MKDKTLETIALILIITGIIILGYIVLTQQQTNIFFKENTNNGYLQGTLTKKTFSEDSGFSYAEIYSCQQFSGFYEGNINITKGQKISVKGTYDGESLFIDDYK